MGLFGGSAQSTNTIQNSIDFAPIFQIGDNNSTDTKKVAEQSATTAPKLDDSFSASASVGVAGGQGGTASLQKQPDYSSISPQPTTAYSAAALPMFQSSALNSDVVTYAVLGAIGLGAIYMFKKG